ncbi:glycosyltransferase family 4 protein [Buttiauxella ferragutiae]|uniref:glycosyltransferase family 4 protein n=1 Tax=Buttiauxella ferragutiae TaxID=82989 RepID=UPI001F52BCAE|nr:glycosyltransferase family 4 protein [Buttiauxella ferragutiae]UNK62858.1 glycosyltransferase family 4 protein [Buttiauxella ferragutiae]
MDLALVIDDYLPYSTRVGAKMFHELAIELKLRGHQVTVITPNSQQKETLKVFELDGITVWQFKSGPIKDVSKLRRAINETLLSFKAWNAIRHHVNSNSFDGLIYYSPSIFWGGVVKKLKMLCNCRAYLVLRDVFPQWVIDAGLLKENSVLVKYFRYFERKTYEQADQIGVMSERNSELFEVWNEAFSCEVLRNWASTKNIIKINNGYISVRERLNLNNKVIYFYGGNIGFAQDMANIMRLVKKMQRYDNAHFLFVGQGDEVSLINNLAKEWNLENFTYLPSVNQDEFKSILAEVDVGLFSLSARHSAHNFPGKLLGYMVESLPILGSVNAGNDLLDIVNSNNAGFIHVNGEDDLLFSSAQKLFLDDELRKSLGMNAKQLLINQFSVESAAQLIVSKLGG